MKFYFDQIITFFQKSIFLNAVISFLFITGLVFIINTKLNLFDIINSATLRNIASALPQSNSIYKGTTNSSVILITNKMFERDFNSKTPINKDSLLKIIRTISNQNPKSIILDLDISPDYNFDTHTTNENEKLFEYLINKSNDINFILPFTFIAKTDENKILKTRWIQSMCKNKINFSFPFLVSEIGTVLQYNNYINHVSIISDNLNKNKSHYNICENFKDSIINLKKLEADAFKEFSLSESIPINYNKINSSTILLNSITEINLYNFENKTVFIGGGYGYEDKYITPYGEKFGVEVLNAIHYSLNHTITKNNISLATIIDIIIGLLFGYIISYLISKRLNIQSNNNKVINNILLITVLISFMYISFIASTIIYHKFYSWINPIPIILGIFIDLIIGMDSKKFNVDLSSSWFNLLIRFGICIIGIYSFLEN